MVKDLISKRAGVTRPGGVTWIYFEATMWSMTCLKSQLVSGQALPRALILIPQRFAQTW